DVLNSFDLKRRSGGGRRQVGLTEWDRLGWLWRKRKAHLILEEVEQVIVILRADCCAARKPPKRILAPRGQLRGRPFQNIFDGAQASSPSRVNAAYNLKKKRRHHHPHP